MGVTIKHEYVCDVVGCDSVETEKFIYNHSPFTAVPRPYSATWRHVEGIGYVCSKHRIKMIVDGCSKEYTIDNTKNVALDYLKENG